MDVNEIKFNTLLFKPLVKVLLDKNKYIGSIKYNR